MLVQTVLGEVIGEAEETVPQDEVLVVSMVGVVDESLVWVIASVVEVGTVGDVGVDVEGGLVVGEVGPVVVFEEVGMPEDVVGPDVELGGEGGVLLTDEVAKGDVVPGDDVVLDVAVVVTGVLERVVDSVGGEGVDGEVIGVEDPVGGLEEVDPVVGTVLVEVGVSLMVVGVGVGVWLVVDVELVLSVVGEVELAVSEMVEGGDGVSVIVVVGVEVEEPMMVVVVT